MNQYVFCANNPVMFVDPQGNQSSHALVDNSSVKTFFRGIASDTKWSTPDESEQGGHAYKDLTTGKNVFVRWPSAGKLSSIDPPQSFYNDMDDPNKEIILAVHSHPIPGNLGPSPGDSDNARKQTRNFPSFVISRTGIYMYCPPDYSSIPIIEGWDEMSRYLGLGN